MYKNKIISMMNVLSEYVIRLILRYIIFPLVRLVWIHKVTGIEHIPKEGSVLIAFNHQSYFDFIGFMAISPRPIYYLAAEKFYGKKTNLLWGPIMQATGQIRVNRKSKDKDEVYKTVYELLRQGKLVGIFPEGTRAQNNMEMLKAFPGIARFSITAQVPVLPVGIKGAYEIMSRHVSKPRFIKVLEFIIGDPIYPLVNKKTMTKEEYQDLTNNIMQEISILSDKKYLYV